MSQGYVGKHGEHAERPGQIPKRGWKEIALRVKDQLNYDHVQVVAAGVAFYLFLSLFPAFAALVSIYGLVMDPAAVQAQMEQLAAGLPTQAHDLLSDIMSQIASKPAESLGLSLLVSVVLSLWSANKSMSALFEGINITYNELDRRGFIRRTALTLVFTLGAIVFMIVAMSLVVGFPALVDFLPLPDALKTVLSLLRWPLLAVLVMGGLSLIYKKAPDRHDPQLRWASWGAGIATLLWILGSALFSFYVNQFGSYDKTYGSLAAVIILMLWLFLTAYVILLGAEINSEMEHQTAEDTTVGRRKPLGLRQAWHADHVAAGRDEGDPRQAGKAN